MGIGFLSLWAVPFTSMHVREAEETLTDTLHIVGGAIVAPLLLVVIALGTSVFGKWYRLYSIVTVLLMFAFVAWTAMDGAAMADNLVNAVARRQRAYLGLRVSAVAGGIRHRTPSSAPRDERRQRHSRSDADERRIRPREDRSRDRIPRHPGGGYLRRSTSLLPNGGPSAAAQTRSFSRGRVARGPG